mgnify:FL=1
MFVDATGIIDFLGQEIPIEIENSVKIHDWNSTSLNVHKSKPIKPDWICKYCQSLNGYDEKNCFYCGSPRRVK